MKKVLIILGAVLIVFGISFSVYKTAMNKQERTEKTEAKILSDYDAFKEKIEIFSKEREEIYAKVFEPYLEDLHEEHAEIFSYMTRYDAAVNDLVEVSKYLAKDGLKYKTNKEDIKEKLEAFKINYEQSINMFVDDATKFNEKIEAYNEYLEENELSDERLATYELKLKYLDLNKDGKFDGKE